ncbi:hypothetical protein [Fischerella sp. PCC 9605]|uniref:hypothetical protein n=1 Tax=Fischerella sp. PCC 9605 TaxID=1173024 RepID=UPI0004B1A10F|nr:hypothetical protein [Fischerella sp. PCC 9605]
MVNPTQLSPDAEYRINGKFGTWRYSHIVKGLVNERYVFWRFTSKNRRKTMSLSRDYVERYVFVAE